MKLRVPAAVLVGLGAAATLLAVEPAFLQGRGHIIGPSSEELMQTASLADLRLQPWRTLWYLHIQPPAFDALRAALAHTFGGDRPYADLVAIVDAWLLRLWAVAYGVTVGLIAHWLGALWRKPSAGAAAALV